MQFLKELLSSIYGPDYYRALPSRSLGSSIKYFVLLILLVVIIGVSTIVIPVTTGIQSFLREGSTKILSEFPNNLMITMKDGKVSTNVKEPYFFPYSAEMRAQNGDQDSHKNFLVIDTKTPFSQEQLQKYDTEAWLTKDSLFINNGEQSRAQSLKDLEDFTLDKKQITNFVQKITPWFPYAAPVALVLIAIAMFIFQLFTLLFLCILTVIFRMAAKLFSIHLSFQDMYKVSIHAVTLGLLLDVLVQALRPLLHIPNIPFMLTVVTCISFYVNVLMQRDIWKKPIAVQSVVKKAFPKRKRK